MECQICLDDLGDWAYCLPCGHIYCQKCVEQLVEGSCTTRNRAFKCPNCRKDASSRISPDNIRKVFLSAQSSSGSASEIQALQKRLQAAERQRDDAVKDFAHFSTTRLDAFLRALEGKDTLLSRKDKEVEEIRKELTESRKSARESAERIERRLEQAEETISRLRDQYQTEVAEHRKTRDMLAMRDTVNSRALLERDGPQVNSVTARSSSTQYIQETFTSLMSAMNVLNPLYGNSSSGSAAPIPTQKQPTAQANEQTFPSTSASASILSPLNLFTSSLPEASDSTDFDRTLLNPSDDEDDDSFDTSINHRYQQSSHADYRKHGKIPSHAPNPPPPCQRREHRHAAKSAQDRPLPTPAKAPRRPEARALKYGADILWRGYGRPRSTAVPECTSSDGYHYFSGKGTNQYATRYTCTRCHFCCSEGRRKS
ncbi:hypothetical protein BDZ97DRAFT_1404616 [Flammula alnicola]|nr:hypothetical protein BDZ97DRAFT_1404616 [Flammula alnicola]